MIARNEFHRYLNRNFDGYVRENSDERVGERGHITTDKFLMYQIRHQNESVKKQKGNLKRFMWVCMYKEVE